MDKWFEFGGVRGVIGVLIGALLTLLASGISLPTLPTPLQGYVYGPTYYNVSAAAMAGPPMISVTLSPAALLVALIIAAIVAFVVCGFQYWLGAKIIEWGGIEVRGVWKAVLAGVIGGIVITVVFAMLVLAGIIGVSFAVGVLTSLAVAAMFAALPVYAIIEAGMAVVTWFVYKQLGWATPE